MGTDVPVVPCGVRSYGMQVCVIFVCTRVLMCICLCVVLLSVACDNCSFDLWLNVVDCQLASTNARAAWWAFVCLTNQSRSVYVCVCASQSAMESCTHINMTT